MWHASTTSERFRACSQSRSRSESTYTRISSPRAPLNSLAYSATLRTSSTRSPDSGFGSCSLLTGKGSATFRGLHVGYSDSVVADTIMALLTNVMKVLQLLINVFTHCLLRDTSRCMRSSTGTDVKLSGMADRVANTFAR